MYLGYRNTSKTIIVHGDVYGDIGEKMTGGRIYHKGKSIDLW
jgi:formylmethanofuran dehydrogenase subunit C